jgi:hypothetical protein
MGCRKGDGCYRSYDNCEVLSCVGEATGTVLVMIIVRRYGVWERRQTPS